MNELALFAGAGGGILGGKLLGWRTVCAVEIDAYARRVLLARQRDGMLEPFPIWDDITTFRGDAWAGSIDIITGGFPCQDISIAGRGAGIEGSRSGLWSEFARVIREVGPRYVLVENSGLLVSRGLGRVLGDLSNLGFDAEWGIVGADDAGAPHKRERIWILAHSSSQRQRIEEETLCSWRNAAILGRPVVSDPMREGQRTPDQFPAGWGIESSRQPESQAWGSECQGIAWWEREPELDRVVNGVPNRVDRFRALGNAQVPAVVQLAFQTLMRRVNEAT